MIRIGRPRASRSFRPSTLDLSRLEPITLLSVAPAAAAVPAPTPSAPPPKVSAPTPPPPTSLDDAVNQVLTAQGQYKADLTEWRFQTLLQQNREILWQNNMIIQQQDVAALKADVREFNFTYFPKAARLRASQVNDEFGDPAHEVYTFTADLTGVPAADRAAAMAEAAALNYRADHLTAGAADLYERGVELDEGWNYIDSIKVGLDYQGGQLYLSYASIWQEEDDEHVDETDFSDRELEVLVAQTTNWMNTNYANYVCDLFDDQYANGDTA